METHVYWCGKILRTPKMNTYLWLNHLRNFEKTMLSQDARISILWILKILKSLFWSFETRAANCKCAKMSHFESV